MSLPERHPLTITPVPSSVTAESMTLIKSSTFIVSTKSI